MQALVLSNPILGVLVGVVVTRVGMAHAVCGAACASIGTCDNAADAGGAPKLVGIELPPWSLP